MRLILLFVLLPLCELFLLIRIGQLIGLFPTIAICIVTGVLGATLTRRSGVSILNRIQGEMSQGRVPAREIVEGLLVLVSGVVLLTPGVMTDAAGFLLLAPPIRRTVAGVLVHHFKGRIRVGGFGPTGFQGGATQDNGSHRAGGFRGSGFQERRTDGGRSSSSGVSSGGVSYSGHDSNREPTDVEFEHREPDRESSES